MAMSCCKGNQKMQAFFLSDNTGGKSQSSIIDREEERFYWEV